MKIVSACLAGVKCRYDGQSSSCRAVADLLRQGGAIPVCPEQLGGLTTPRIPSEKRGDGVFMKDGRDVTAQFERGAQEARRIAGLAGCKEAILKARSPSCGYGKIYDGSFSGRLVAGNGVFAGMIEKDGVEIITEEDL